MTPPLRLPFESTEIKKARFLREWSGLILCVPVFAWVLLYWQDGLFIPPESNLLKSIFTAFLIMVSAYLLGVDKKIPEDGSLLNALRSIAMVIATAAGLTFALLVLTTGFNEVVPALVAAVCASIGGFFAFKYGGKIKAIVKNANEAKATVLEELKTIETEGTKVLALLEENKSLITALRDGTIIDSNLATRLEKDLQQLVPGLDTGSTEIKQMRTNLETFRQTMTDLELMVKSISHYKGNNPAMLASQAYIKDAGTSYVFLKLYRASSTNNAFPENSFKVLKALEFLGKAEAQKTLRLIGLPNLTITPGTPPADKTAS